MLTAPSWLAWALERLLIARGSPTVWVSLGGMNLLDARAFKLAKKAYLSAPALSRQRALEGGV